MRRRARRSGFLATDLKVLMFEVELERVGKRFDGGATRTNDKVPARAALDAVSIGVRRGELLVVVGPSGCGKSTMLRIVAGLEEADEGSVRIGGKSMDRVPPQDRDVAMVFQGYALYPQMTVRENIEFPLRMRSVAAKERREQADAAASMLRLMPLMDRLPSELSGGERQRVAMGRAIVRKPRVFLFDEPLSNLDAALRQDLRVEIGALVRALGTTAIYVTHDQVEAMTLADRICVMHAGQVLQIDEPRAIYETPATRFVATFLGSPRMNLLDGRVDATGIAAGPFRVPNIPRLPVGERVVVGVRPEDVRPVREGDDGAARFELVLSEPLGAETHWVLRAEPFELRVRVAGFDRSRPGTTAFVSLDASRLHFFASHGLGARLA